MQFVCVMPVSLPALVVDTSANLCYLRYNLALWIYYMTDLDNQLISLLRRNGRASLSELAADLKVTRATVRVHMDRLQQTGQIAGFTVLTPADIAPHPVRGLMMLEIAGQGTQRILQRLRAMLPVTAVHTTNGTWDLIVEIGTESLEAFDSVLTAIRTFDGVTRSETSLLLTSRR